MTSDVDDNAAHDLRAARMKKWAEKFPPRDQADVLLIAHFFRVLSNAPAKTHSVFRPLWESYVGRLKAYLETPKQQRATEKLIELDELRSWLLPPREKLTSEHENLAGNLFVARGSSYSEAREKIQEVRKLNAGRPRSTAQMAIRGLELLISNPDLTHAELAAQVCDCDSKKHDDACANRLRPAIAALQSLLGKFNIAPGSRSRATP